MFFKQNVKADENPVVFRKTESFSIPLTYPFQRREGYVCTGVSLQRQLASFIILL